MRIMIVTNHAQMLWKFRRELVDALLERAEVTLCMPFDGYEKKFEALGCRCIEVDVDRRGMNPYVDSRLYAKYRSVLQEERPDFAILYSIKPNVYAGYACRRLEIPFYAHVQGLGSAFYRKGLKQIVTRMYKIGLKTAEKVFFENQSDAKCFIQHKIIPKEKAVLLHGAGVNLQHFVPLPYPDESQGIRFLFVGRIMKEKGIEELFEAARKLKQRGYRFTLDLAGFFEENYQEAVRKMMQQGIVRFHGFKQDVRPLYVAAHCVVLPSYHEGMSNVLLEGAACARALITTDVPGCREAVEPGKNGLLCRRADANSLYRCFKTFLDMQTDERKRMGEAGRRLVEKYFDRQEVVKRTLEVLPLDKPKPV